MTLGPDADQTLFKDTLRRYLSARSPLTRVRETMLSDSPFDSEVWLGLVEMGVPGMAIPEEFGGAGGGFFELGIVAEELGRALAPVPFLSTVVLAAGAISLVGTPEQKKQLLPEIAAGERLATVALTDGNAGPAAVEETGDGFVLNGSKSFVLDGQVADTVIVAAAGPQATVELLIVDADMKGIEWSGLSTMDLTRPQAEVSFDAVRLPETARLGNPGSGRETVTELLDQAATALAFEQVGGAERCLEMSVEYAKDRRQFAFPRQLGLSNTQNLCTAGQRSPSDFIDNFVAGRVRTIG